MKALRTGLIFLKIVRFSHDLQIFEEKLDYWTHAIALVTSNNSFGPTEISYLENQFTNIAKDAGRYQVTNGNDPSPGTVTEEKQAELDEFIDYARLITGALGYRVFEPVDDVKARDKPALQDPGCSCDLTV